VKLRADRHRTRNRTTRFAGRLRDLQVVAPNQHFPGLIWRKRPHNFYERFFIGAKNHNSYSRFQFNATSTEIVRKLAKWRLAAPLLAVRVHHENPMDTIVMLMFMLTGRHPGEPARSYKEVPAIQHGRDVLWHDPGNVERLDFRYGVGGRALVPQPPFTFVKEDLSGTTAKVVVRDAHGRNWAVRFGAKTGPDVFVSRLAWGLGYRVEPTYYVASGLIRGTHDLRRARHDIGPDGRFDGARFQLRSQHPEFLKDVSWAWDQNPFVGTHQLQGLKVLVMLVSCWDDKDLHQASRLGSNVGILRDGDRYLFFVDDWGRSMGHSGSRLHRSTWNADDYLRQTPEFVTGVKDGEVGFKYKGQNTRVIRNGISISDVRWLLTYLSRVTNSQIREGLLSSGASPEQSDLFGGALRTRIRELQSVAGKPDLTHRTLASARR
jgi:hypothetical protein